MTIEKNTQEITTHSVEFHLRLSVNDYDRIIRTFVPHYDEMHMTAVAIINGLIKQPAKFLELGGGTGALTQMILKNCPLISMEMIDIDDEMLKRARHRLAQEIECGRVCIRYSSFFDQLPKSMGVIAALALHHIHDFEQKTHVYKSIYQALEPGGIFLNLDATINAQEQIRNLSFAQWASWMNAHGIDDKSAYTHFADWAKEDRYFSLGEELEALSKAGFISSEIFWRRGPMAIYGGIKNQA